MKNSRRMDLLRVGREVGTYQDEIIQERAHSRIQARTQFLEACSQRRAQKSSPRTRWHWAAYMAGFAAVATSTLYWFQSQKSLSFTVAEQQGKVGAWIASSISELPVSFSDGTQLQLNQESQARVMSINHVGANVLLERGTLHADVVHTSKSRWAMQAGPFEVRVTGTRFDLTWDPSDQQLTLHLHQGSVIVSGCAMPQKPVVAGQSIRMRCHEGQYVPLAGNDTKSVTLTNTHTASNGLQNPEPMPSTLNTTPNLIPSATTQSLQSPTPSNTYANPKLPELKESKFAELLPSNEKNQPTATPATSESIVTTPSTPIIPIVPLSWKELIAQGKTKEAFASIMNDFDAECERANVQELMLLADLARAMRDFSRAKKALLTIRNRFPDSSHTVTAAFLLGRFAQNAHVYREATKWFSIALQTQPSGSLAREALGRLMEVQKAQGDSLGSKKSAQEYLKQYSKGPHAELAKSLLNS